MTTFTNGGAESVALGVKLKIIGVIMSDGRLLASNLSLRPTNAIRAEGDIQAIDLVAGTVTLLDVTFSTRALLKLEDKSSAEIDPLTLGDLGVGDELFWFWWNAIGTVVTFCVGYLASLAFRF